MVNSIASTPVIASSVTPASTGILQSQLRRYEIQLADWCACPSAKTPAGKEKIADLQAKADATKAQLQQADATRSQSEVAETGATTNAQSVPGQVPGGRLLDVFA